MYHPNNLVKRFFSKQFVVSRKRRSMTHAILAAHEVWRQRFPLWDNAGFDRYFLLHDALPLLSAMITGEQKADGALLASTWANALKLTGERAQRARNECSPAAAAFLTLLLAHKSIPNKLKH